MRTRCLLVDDEPLALKVLENHIESVPHLEIVSSCANAFAAMEVLKQQPIDLMFLDIQMPKLMGTSFLRTLRNPPKVIFTTAYKDYAVDAIAQYADYTNARSESQLPQSQYRDS